MTPELAVVIFSRDDADHLERCLDALRRSPPSCAFEVVVVDNASSDRTPEVVTRSAEDLSIRALRLGIDSSFSDGNNRGWRASEAPFVLFLNPDTLPTGPALDACLDRLRLDPSLGAVSPRLRYPDGAPQETGWHLPTVGRLLVDVLLRRPREVPADPSGLTRVGWLMGCCLMCPRSALRLAEGWDPGFWFHGTDLEFCARLGRLGLGVARLEGVQIVHVGHRGWGQERRRRVRQAQQLWLLRDHGPLAAGLYGLASGLREAPRS